ncbi:hypothetical protein IG631_03632 [Alternaria alternata]|nr:hypothetical protein IG631_03632 [Alternaria alternata]
MAAIQNFKNFLRHGKQARQNAEPTTNVSNVHAQSQHQRYNQHPDPVHHGISEPVMDHKPLQNHAAPHGDFSVGAGAGDNRNIAAQAGDAAAHAAAKDQKKQAAAKNAGVDPSVLERIVAEEREAKGKLPRYPGLERWTLLEKMGDGAFSNVYRARDTTGQWDEVAIKVVRKFEMNSQQSGVFGRYQREAGVGQACASGLQDAQSSRGAIILPPILDSEHPPPHHDWACKGRH